jgi:hypothetical protein
MIVFRCGYICKEEEEYDSLFIRALFTDDGVNVGMTASFNNTQDWEDCSRIQRRLTVQKRIRKKYVNSIEFPKVVPVVS